MHRLPALLLITLLLGVLAPGSSAVASSRPLQFTAKSDTIDLVGLEQHFRDVARRLPPSVVAITASSEMAPVDAAFRSTELSADLIERMLRGGPRVVGTGFCIDEDGYILTNEHVIRDARQLYITTDDGRSFPAMVVGSDPRSDLAVLKIPGKLPPVTFAAPGSVYRGQWTVAIGNPVGLAGAGSMCMSVGVVSATNRELPKLSEREGRIYSNLIQTTAEVNPGNSGGPLFDLNGNVLGIITAVVLPHKTTNGLGFAIPTDASVLAKVERLKRGHPVIYGYLGIAVRDHAGAGVWVDSVGENTPASGVLLPGDLLIRIDGQAISDQASYVRLVGAAPLDRTVPLVISRNGREMALNVRLSPHPNVPRGVDLTTQRLFWRGAALTTAASDPEGGVRVGEIQAGSPLIGLGLRQGSVIRTVGGKPVRDLVGLLHVLEEMSADQALAALAPVPEHRTAIASGVSEYATEAGAP